MRFGLARTHLTFGLDGSTTATLNRGGLTVVAAMAAAACAVSWMCCVHQGMAAPLWLDESWTGAFASEPSLTGLTEQIRSDANAPLYYYVIWFWARAFGFSNLSLHVPSLLFSLATPVVAWAGLRRARPMLACVWAAMLALWIPGIIQAGDARCYALLLFLSVATAIAIVRAHEKPTLGRALGWAVSACLMTLTHYHAGGLALAQGLILAARYRGQWRETWPATLAFLPGFTWILWHAPRLAAFAQPGVAWYDPLTLADLPTVLWFLLGPPLSEAALPAALAVCIFMSSRARVEVGSQGRRDAAVIATGAASFAALAFCLVVAALRPTFTFRYLTPFVPGLLLVIASVVIKASRSRWQPLAILMGGWLVSVLFVVSSEDVARMKAYGFETASAWIAEAAPARLVFFWDHPATPVEMPGQLDAVGGFFLRRAGLSVNVVPIYPQPSPDMNGPVLAAGGSDSATLWIYDTEIHGTTARRFPPRLGQMDSGLECRDFGIANIGVMACRRTSGRR